VCERAEVRDRIFGLATVDPNGRALQPVSITGEKDLPARLHAPIKGCGTNTRGATSSRLICQHSGVTERPR
jgi:hypothetical protein